MPPVTRRSFLTATALVAAAPALAAVPVSREVEIAIIGAGAAGIAAARRIAAANRRFVIIEASDRVGGRCLTETQTFGVPYDRGAHWLHMPDINPVAKLGKSSGFDVYTAPPGQKIRIGRRYAREGEIEEYLAALVRANRAIADSAAGKADVSCGQALPKNLADWKQTVEFVLGPFGCGKDINDISAADFAKSAERDAAGYCRQGLGALVAKLADGLPVQLATPVTGIDAGGRGNIEIYTGKGTFFARALIVTVSTNVLASGKIRFNPEPRRHFDAANKLRLGSYDHVMLELAGNPLGLLRDELVFEKSESAQTGALLANIGGTSLCAVEVGGKFGRDLADKGSDAMTAFALEWMTTLFGADVRKAVQRTHATRWNDEPWVMGAFSSASPGNQWARRALMEVYRDRIWFAGEAAHETLWGTVGGAWESGERAADAALRLFRAAPAPSKPGKGRRG